MHLNSTVCLLLVVARATEFIAQGSEDLNSLLGGPPGPSEASSHCGASVAGEVAAASHSAST